MSAICVAQTQEVLLINYSSSHGANAALKAQLAQQAATLYADAVALSKAADAVPAYSAEICEAKLVFKKYEAP